MDIVSIYIRIEMWFRQSIDDVDAPKSWKVMLEQRILSLWERRSEKGHTGGFVGNVPSANGTTSNGTARPSPARRLKFCYDFIRARTASWDMWLVCGIQLTMHEIRVKGAKLAAMAGPNQAGSSGAATTVCANPGGTAAVRRVRQCH